ncbi:MAG: 30S ribosomal protein S16, partial [Psychrobacter celer]
ENIGFFNPLAKESEEAVRLNMEAYNAWIAKGAQPSDRVASLAKAYSKSAAQTEATA